MRRLKSSFRDPDGYVAQRGENIVRVLTESGQANITQLHQSGLYSFLTENKMLVQHGQVDANVLQPERIPFISYPQEWCFSMLQQAALLTLDAEMCAVGHGMTLKDASAYNVQYRHGKPILIDSLSFMPYKEGMPWFPYRQFCKHFLAPLAAWHHKGIRLQYGIDGADLHFPASLVGIRQMGLRGHLIMGLGESRKSNASVSINRLRRSALLSNLYNCVADMKVRIEEFDYDLDPHYEQAKAIEVEQKMKTAGTKRVLDIGCFHGKYSSYKGALAVGIDRDHNAVEEAHIKGKSGILPLWVDINSPTPSMGWGNQERPSFLERATNQFDVVLVLALMHHLILDNQVNFQMMAKMLAKLKARHLLMEWVPPKDPRVIEKSGGLDYRIPHWWNQNCFEGEFRQWFDMKSITTLPPTERELYHFTLRS